MAPATVTVDFVVGLTAAISDEIPATILHVCYIHFKQGIWRNIQFLRLVQQYKVKNEVMTVCWQLMALPFIPVAAVNQAYTIMEEVSAYNIGDNLHELFVYYRDQWIEIDAIIISGGLELPWQGQEEE